jgi:hypothetical protein
MLSGNTPSPPTNAQVYKQAEILQIVAYNALAPLVWKDLCSYVQERSRRHPSPDSRFDVSLVMVYSG